MTDFKAYVIAVTSLLAGASVVHNYYKPDLVGPKAVMGTDQRVSFDNNRQITQFCHCALQSIPVAKPASSNPSHEQPRK